MIRIKKLLPMLLVCGFSASVFADNAVKTQIEAQVKSWVKIEMVEKKSILQKMVFACDFYMATPVIVSPDGSESSSGGHLFYSKKGVNDTVTEPSTTTVMPELLSCLKPDFRVKNEDNAMLFLEAADQLFSRESMFDEAFEKRVEKTPNGWTLITGEFFDDFKGYQLTTDAKGKVIKVRYSLNL